MSSEIMSAEQIKNYDFNKAMQEYRDALEKRRVLKKQITEKKAEITKFLKDNKQTSYEGQQIGTYKVSVLKDRKFTLPEKVRQHFRRYESVDPTDPVWALLDKKFKGIEDYVHLAVKESKMEGKELDKPATKKLQKAYDEKIKELMDLDVEYEQHEASIKDTKDYISTARDISEIAKTE